MKSFFIHHSSFVIFHLFLLSAVVAHAASVGRVDLDSLRTPIYTVDGGSFVRHNGDRYCNRPLYCNQLSAVVLAGDKPFVRLASGKYINGTLMLALVRGKHGVWFQNASDISSRYECGRMSWTVADHSWGDTSFEVEVVPFAAGPGLAMRIIASHPQPGDQLIWAAGGVTESSDSALWHYDVTTAGREALLHRGFTPSDCRGNSALISGSQCSFQGRGSSTYVACDAPSLISYASADYWQDPVPSGRSTKNDMISGTVQLP
ncbi:MAG TPA: DUF4450 domain-containing protein, partial [Tepidisphaeraceae bacterium]|nr:DUF4450 domain-containing protein [Tepidisphaeraceae bacterium]